MYPYIDTTGTTSESSVAAVLTKEKFKCENFLPCDPRRKPHRYILFFLLMCMLVFGRYYCYDNPNALQSTIINVSHCCFFVPTLIIELNQMAGPGTQ